MNYRSQSQRPFAASPKAVGIPNAPANSSRYNRSVITLSADEERFVEALRLLPPEVTESVIRWTTQLSKLAPDRAVEWSDAWTEEDLADLQRASLGNFDSREEDLADNSGETT